jgi:hypothetical protein
MILRASSVIVHSDRHTHLLEHWRVSDDRELFLRAVEWSDHPEAAFISSFQQGEQYWYPAQRRGAP